MINLLRSLFPKKILSLPINIFITKFKEQFELLDEGEIIEIDTEFQKIDGWDSLTALMILEMIDEEFDADISGDELRACVTIEDLYKLSMAKAA